MMKQHVLILFMLFTSSSSFLAQTISDDFEGYAIGQLIATSSTDWTTFSDTLGGPEDVPVTDSDAWSGTKSLYFSSELPNGGPGDILLKLGGPHILGSFELEWKMKVEEGKGAYIDFGFMPRYYFLGDGTLRIQDGGERYFHANYPQGVWFDARCEVNASTNSWNLYINDQFVLSHGAANHFVESMRFTPFHWGDCGSESAGFWIDDAHFEYTPVDSLPQVNAGIPGLSSPFGFPGDSFPALSTIRNQGLDTINSFSVELSYNGLTEVYPFTMTIPPMESYFVELNNSLPFAEDTLLLTARLVGVNGLSVDGDTSDDQRVKAIIPYHASPGKMMVIESLTSTQCASCVGGIAIMNHLEEQYPGHFIAINVHADDPMAYNDYVNNLLPNGAIYPYHFIDRAFTSSNNYLFTALEERAASRPKAQVLCGARFNDSTQILDVALQVIANASMIGPLSASIVLLEDSVTGNGSGYDQANNASIPPWINNTFQVLPNPIPSSQIAYNNVARFIAPDAQEVSPNIPSGIESGDTAIVTFQIPIDSAWDFHSLRIVGMVLNQCDKIDNASSTPILEALANGYQDDISEASNQAVIGVNAVLFPNPTNGDVHYKFFLPDAQEIYLSVLSSTGAEIFLDSYALQPGHHDLLLPSSKWQQGIYFLHWHSADSHSIQRLVVH